MPDILFLTLRVFSATGGIEKVCRVAGKALYEYGVEYNHSVRILSMYDERSSAFNNLYFPTEIFLGFGINKPGFIFDAARQGKKAKCVVISHINLLPVAWLIKKVNPNVKLVMFAHGIEIWGKLPASKRSMLSACDKILAVSAFTRETVISMHGIDAAKVCVINNSLDPFLPIPKVNSHRADFFKRFGFDENDKVIFTLTRISAKEKYKGYDNVLEAISQLYEEGYPIRYIIGGKYDMEEKKVLDEAIARLKIQDRVVITGFLPDEDLPDYFANADVYTMPSKKEGFGIVFIEAMFYGAPVIAGDKDGSVDALMDGKLGVLVDPDNVSSLKAAIQKVISAPGKFKPSQDLLMDNFSYTAYKEKISGAVHIQLNKKISTLN